MDIAYGAAMRVLTSGRHIGKIEAMNADGFRLIEELALDAVKITETRKLFIETIRSFESMANPLLFQWMGFPKDIPDLANVHPAPKSNSKPKGIEQSWFALKTRGRLPLFYE
ncbi:MAG: hypothetical protein SFY80_17400 [Verrucomicrobiota bacterium]|nr:hypothetical protein [Verrucomicrobiota bacterium]